MSFDSLFQFLIKHTNPALRCPTTQATYHTHVMFLESKRSIPWDLRQVVWRNDQTVCDEGRRSASSKTVFILLAKDSTVVFMAFSALYYFPLKANVPVLTCRLQQRQQHDEVELVVVFGHRHNTTLGLVSSFRKTTRLCNKGVSAAKERFYTLSGGQPSHADTGIYIW
jgi:hypothetical protein